MRQVWPPLGDASTLPVCAPGRDGSGLSWLRWVKNLFPELRLWRNLRIGWVGKDLRDHRVQPPSHVNKYHKTLLIGSCLFPPQRSCEALWGESTVCPILL